MSRIKSDDTNEFQEIKRRLRQKGSRNTDFRRLLLIVAVVAVFQLGIAAGIIISTKKEAGRKGNTEARNSTVTALLPQQTVAGPPAASSLSPAPPATDKAVMRSAETKVEQQPEKREEVREQPVTREKRPPARETRPKKKRLAKLAPTPRLPLPIDVAGGDIGRAYAAGMRTIIERHKVNPVTAGGTSIEGRCLIVCIIRRDGSLKHAEVIRTSGNPVLDDAALRSVHKAGKFPAVPNAIPGDVLSFDVPLTFRSE